MKKNLLLACVFATALSASAQTAVIGKSFTVEQLKENTVNKVLATTTALKTVDEKNVVAAAPEQNSLSGNYIEASLAAIYECSAATVTANDGNVTFSISNGSASFTGAYDATSGLITVNTQEAGVYTDSRGTFTFAFYGLEEDAASEEINVVNSATFTVSDKGDISCNQIGYAIGITDFEPAAGSSLKKEELVGKWWTLSWETRFMPINGEMAGINNTVESAGWSGWKEFSLPVAIEDLEYTVNVFNMCGMGCASIDIYDDGTVSMAMGQPMLAFSSSDPDIYGEYFTLKGVGVDDEGYLFIDYDMTEVKGTISGNTITFDDFFINCSNLTEEGRGYFDGYYRPGTTIALNEGNYTATGIQEVTETREEKIKNTKTYNLMGQQVDRATAKGILIRNGKKYIKKF